MDYRNRRLALDEVFLDGHALTGLQIIKYRDLFMLKIKGSKLTNNGTKVSKEDWDYVWSGEYPDYRVVSPSENKPGVSTIY